MAWRKRFRQRNALLNKRTYVTPDDCKAMIYSVLRHRITLNYTAIADGIKVENVIASIMGAINTPWDYKELKK